MRIADFNDEIWYLGAHVRVDEVTYEICEINGAECGDGFWQLVFAHYLPQTLSEEEWDGLYRNPDLAS